MSGRQQLWTLFVLFAGCGSDDLFWLAHSSLWGDEVFSLAIATGHSLEHPAAAARPERGDFVEPDHPVPAEEFRKYLKHDSPLESPARVVRAALLSDTSPPFITLLFYAWTLLLGTSDIALAIVLDCLFAVVLAVACAHRSAGGGRWNSPCQCVLFAFSPLAIYYSTEGRMYSLVWLCVLATIWVSLVLHQRGRRHWLPGTLGSHVGGWISDALLLSLSMASHRRVSGHLSWEIWATPLIWMHFS